MAIYKWRNDAASDDPRRGPCDAGFHVPTSSERGNINAILASAWFTESAINSYLKMPTSGLRSGSSSSTVSGTYGYYWSCTPASSNESYSFFFRWTTTNIASRSRCSGHNIRWIKDVPVVPDSSWIQLTSVVSIYWNQSVGLISISGDGAIWFTIQDKNVWATVVYNSVDALTEANCGTFFQRWNNYWFPYSGTVTTSSTQVDASGYWPNNYYSSSTFITGGGDWSSVENDDLRGYTTWSQ